MRYEHITDSITKYSKSTTPSMDFLWPRFTYLNLNGVDIKDIIKPEEIKYPYQLTDQIRVDIYEYLNQLTPDEYRDIIFIRGKDAENPDLINILLGDVFILLFRGYIPEHIYENILVTRKLLGVVP